MSVYGKHVNLSRAATRKCSQTFESLPAMFLLAGGGDLLQNDQKIDMSIGCKAQALLGDPVFASARYMRRPQL